MARPMARVRAMESEPEAHHTKKKPALDAYPSEKMFLPFMLLPNIHRRIFSAACPILPEQMSTGIVLTARTRAAAGVDPDHPGGLVF